MIFFFQLKFADCIILAFFWMSDLKTNDAYVSVGDLDA